MRIANSMSLTSKTVNVFDKDKALEYKRKGHPLENPNDKQKSAIYLAELKRAKIHMWSVEDNVNQYKLDYNWPERDESMINRIIISSTNNEMSKSIDIFNEDLSVKDNPIFGNKPAPAISCHFFLNVTGFIEKVLPFNYKAVHTNFNNERSINVMIQYKAIGNDLPPCKKIIENMEKVTAMLCLQYKLNPLKAIVAQNELLFSKIWIPGFGRKTQKVGVGKVFNMNNFRREVTMILQRKLKMAKLYEGPVNGKVNRQLKLAINNFGSESIQLLYKGAVNAEHINEEFYDDDYF